ncbi:hypothetical protein ACHAWF_014996, partial [Thalassiosira exigua]
EAEEKDKEPKGAGNRWQALVKLVQVIWERGEIPRQLLWVIVVLLPKGGGDYRGIGILEPIWKLLEAIIDRRLNAIEFHDCLHGYLPQRGTTTAMVEAKLAIQFAQLEQHPFYGIFVDLKKAFDDMDRERCICILKEGYGVGPKMRRLIKRFWDEAEQICRAAGNYGTPLKAGRGVTQDGPLLPKLFNVLINAIVRAWC